jgi:PAS domain protein
MMYEWAEEMNCAVTVTDADCNIIFMNKKARATFASHGDLIGKNLNDCHSERSKEIIARLLATGGTNSYTIRKRGIRKMIYQTAWMKDGKVGGLVEISMEIPEDMPHYDRDAQ